MMKLLLDIRQLSKQYSLNKQTFYAVQNVSFSIQAGEILGIGGESGCGKSTIGKMAMGLIEPTSGSIFFEGAPLSDLIRNKSSHWRRHIQMIFQHPTSSLNPRMKIKKIIEEPLLIHRLTKKEERKERVKELLLQVGLTEEFLDRLPHELSGGQKQRVSIARALALNPRLLICDEPFASLDVSIQAQIINLLSKLQKEHDLSYLIISHDLSILHYLTDRLLILYLGQMMEYGPSREIYSRPLHPYTQALISAVLLPDPLQEKKRSHIAIKGEVPSLISPSTGCPFFLRCPHATKVCEKVKPEWKEVNAGHFTACHLYL